MSRHQHDALGLLDREDGARDAPFHARQVQVGRRVVQDVMVSHQPAEPPAHRRQPRVLRAERQRLPVFLPVVVEIPLIAFQDRARHFHRVLDAALLGPADEVSYRVACVLGGVFRVVFHQQPFEMFFQQAAQRCVRLGFALALNDQGHHFAPAAAAPLGFAASDGTTTMRFSSSLSLVVFFSRFRPRSPFCRASAGDSSPAPPPDTPRTWGRLDPDFSPSRPDFFAS